MSMICLLSWMGLILSANEASVAVTEPTETFGHAVVSQILCVDQTCTIYCDIEGFPPIIGKNMPIKINGLKTANSRESNQNLQVFLFNLLLDGKDTPKQVHLKHLRRGETFCFLADIEVDGEDLCDLLVENGLAQRVIKVSEPEPPARSPRQSSQITPPRTNNRFVASKTSKIFHRTECAHTKRMDTDKAVYFSSRQEAERTGRQPCKTCKP